MRTKPRNPWWLVLGISGISLVAWFVNAYLPDTALRIAYFFIIFFATSFFLSQFLLNNMRRAVLVSLGLSIFLLLRLLGLREPLYGVLLLSSLISLGLLIKR